MFLGRNFIVGQLEFIAFRGEIVGIGQDQRQATATAIVGRGSRGLREQDQVGPPSRERVPIVVPLLVEGIEIFQRHVFRPGHKLGPARLDDVEEAVLVFVGVHAVDQVEDAVAILIVGVDIREKRAEVARRRVDIQADGPGGSRIVVVRHHAPVVVETRDELVVL